jgi:hypothetical protein
VKFLTRYKGDIKESFLSIPTVSAKDEVGTMNESSLFNVAIPRSGFVTGLAWTFITLAGFATLIALIQNIMLTIMLPAEAIHDVMRGSEGRHPMPAFARFMFENFRFLFVSFLVLSAVTLISAIGFLKRRNWARLVFIGIMALGIAWNLAAIAMPFFISSSFPPLPEHAPVEFRDRFDLMWKVMTVFTSIMALAFSVLFAWIIKRLVSDQIKREFRSL